MNVHVDGLQNSIIDHPLPWNDRSVWLYTKFPWTANFWGRLLWNCKLIHTVWLILYESYCMSQPTWDSDPVMKTLKSKTGGVRIKQQTINIKPNATDVIQLEMSGKIGKHLVFITGKYSFIHVTRDPFWFSGRLIFIY